MVRRVKDAYSVLNTRRSTFESRCAVVERRGVLLLDKFKWYACHSSFDDKSFTFDCRGTEEKVELKVNHYRCL